MVVAVVDVIVAILVVAPTSSTSMAIVIMVAGVGAVSGGVLSKIYPISWVGFLICLTGLSILAAGLKGKVIAIANGQRPEKPAKKGFKERMDNRWDDRGRDSME